MFDIDMRTDSYEHLMEDFALYNEWAPMRRMAVGGHKHIFEVWENMERFHCDMVMMYDQIQCKGMQGIVGMFEDDSASAISTPSGCRTRCPTAAR